MIATEALAALGAELTLARAADPGPPDVVTALQAVSAAAALPDLAGLPEPQRDMVIGLVRMVIRQAADLVDEPTRAPGWSFTDPDILQGWGRGSMVVPSALAAAPELGDVRSFLDVGAGVGLLAIAAAGVWPDASIVGIDVWEPSLERAAENVRRAGLEERVAIRNQDVVDIADVDAYDCVWFPTFFVDATVLDAAVPRLYRALRPGGWLVLGRMAAPPDPLAEAVTTLRIVRSGGTPFDGKQLVTALEAAGCTAVRTLPRVGPAPLEYVIGQRPVGEDPA